MAIVNLNNLTTFPEFAITNVTSNTWVVGINPALSAEVRFQVKNINHDTLSGSGTYSHADLDYMAIELSGGKADWDSVYTIVQANSATWQPDGTIDYPMRSLSANWQDTFLTYAAVSAATNDTITVVQTNSADWADHRDLGVRALTGFWDEWTETYAVVSAASANWDSSYVTVLANSGDWGNHFDASLIQSASGGWDNVESIVQANSAYWAPDGTMDFDVRALTANWQETYTAYSTNSSQHLNVDLVVQTNSADWADHRDLGVRSLTGFWDEWTETYAVVSAASANWDSVYSNVNSNSAEWSDTAIVVQANSAAWLVDNDTTQDVGVRVLTANWESTYSTVNSNSANWNSAYSQVNTLSTTEWNGTYTTVQTNSADWGNHFDATLIQSTSANWDTTYTVVIANSALWESHTDVSLLSAAWEETYTNYSQNSALYENIATTVQINSSTWAIDTIYDDSLLQSTSANWDSNYTSVLNGSGDWYSVYNTVNTNSADWQSNGGSGPGGPYDHTLLETTSANWNSVYTSVNSNSALWADVYTTTFNNSAAWGVDTIYDDSALQAASADWGSVYTSVNSNSAGWENTETVVQNNSASWADTASSVPDNGVRALTANWESTYTTVFNTSADWVSNDFDQIYFVSKNGSDSNTGKSLHETKLTISNALDTAYAVISSTPSISAIRLEILDGGYYEESFTVYSGIQIHGPAATVNGQISLDIDSSISLHKHECPTGPYTVFIETSASGSFSYEVDVLDGRGFGGNAGIYYVDNSNTVGFVKVRERHFVDDNGQGILFSGTGNNHLHYNAGDLYLSNNSVGIYMQDPSHNFVGFIDHILTLSGKSGTTGIKVTDGEVKLVTTEIRANTAYDISSIGELYLHCPRLSGTRIGSGIIHEVSEQTYNNDNWDSSYTTVFDNSASWAGGGYDHTLLESTSANWDSVYSNVNSNSSTWANHFDASLIQSTSANWDSVYTITFNTSADWSSVYNTVLANSATWVPDGTSDFAVRSLTANWQSTYTTVFGNSASWTGGGYDHTLLESTSANWDSVYTTTFNNSAAWANHTDITLIQTTSGNWNSVYSNVNSNSASWENTQTVVEANSSTWAAGGGGGADSEVRALTANWESTYTTVNSNSSTWGTGGGGGGSSDLAGRNNTGATLTKGSPVFITNYNTTSSDALLDLASSNYLSAADCVGLMKADLSHASQSDTAVQTEGYLTGLDTSSFANSDPVYVGGTAGTLQNYPGVYAKKLGQVVYSHASSGIILLQPDANVFETGTGQGSKIFLFEGSLDVADTEIVIGGLNFDYWDSFEIEFGLIQPATNNVNLTMEFLSGGGTMAGSYEAVNNYGEFSVNSSGSLGYSGTTNVVMIGGVGNLSNEGIFNTKFTVCKNNGIRQFLKFNGFFTFQDGDTYTIWGGSTLETNVQADGIRMYFSSGNIAAGATWKVWGIKGG